MPGEQSRHRDQITPTRSIHDAGVTTPQYQVVQITQSCENRYFIHHYTVFKRIQYSVDTRVRDRFDVL